MPSDGGESTFPSQTKPSLGFVSVIVAVAMVHNKLAELLSDGNVCR
jgi:hypothetical protein